MRSGGSSSLYYHARMVAEGDKDHGGIPVTPAITDQPIDLGAGQVLPLPIMGRGIRRL